MVAIWVAPALSGSIDDDGVVRLSDGRTFNLSDVPGNGYNANRLAKINARIQQAIDDTYLRTSLPIDDPDRTATNADFIAQGYGGRMFRSDANGVLDDAGDYITSRTTLIWLTWDGTNLIPHVAEVL
jgi:hypothetical protein